MPGLGADALDDFDRRQQNRLPAQILDERLGQHDALVGLPREELQRLPDGAVVLHGKGPEPEDGLQFHQVFPACLDPLTIHRPRFRGDLELRGHQP